MDTAVSRARRPCRPMRPRPGPPSGAERAGKNIEAPENAGDGGKESPALALTQITPAEDKAVLPGILDHFAIGIMLVDERARVLHANSAARALLGEKIRLG